MSFFNYVLFINATLFDLANDVLKFPVLNVRSASARTVFCSWFKELII